MNDCRVEYYKHNIHISICRRERKYEKYTLQGGLIVIPEYSIYILTSDIVKLYKPLDRYDRDSIYRSYIIEPIDFTKIIVRDLNHGIRFRNFLNRGEILIIDIRLAKFRRIYNLSKLISKQIFKIVNLEEFKIQYVDFLCQVFRGRLDKKIQSIRPACRSSIVELYYQNTKVLLDGKFRCILTKFGDKPVLYIFGVGKIKIFAIYPTLGRELNVVDVGSRVENDVTIVVGSFRV